VYAIDNSGSVMALPATFPQTSNYATVVNYSYYLHQVNITIQDTDLIQGDYPGPISFKVVKIAGSEKISMPGNINLKNYSEVAEYFNL
ncbi:MAG TPA: hypothetical protein VK927_00305, partial [Adhaeribacter sp.]|nr:hypothetical protein [Adhaeribacter sp.]